MFIGIDLGGTKISGLVLDADGRECSRHRCPTPAGYDQTLDALAALVVQLEAAAGCHGLPVGLGLPGLVDPAAGMVRAVNLPWLAGRPFGADLAVRLGRPVPMANDANCFALSEATDGAAAGATVVFGAVLGTGVGGGIVVEGRVLRGAHGVAGEWGHIPLPGRTGEDGPALFCGCGRLGCIETVLSGGGLVASYKRLGGGATTAAEIARYSFDGDQLAKSSLERYFSALARSLAVVVNLLDPDAIVLGGGLSALPGLVENVARAWRGLALVAEPRTRLVRAAHGADSGVRGAAWLARQQR